MMYHFKFFDDHEIEGKSEQELKRLELIDRGMVANYEYDDLADLSIDELEHLFKTYKPNGQPKAKAKSEPINQEIEKVKTEAPFEKVHKKKVKRILPRSIDEAFVYRKGKLWRVEYQEKDGKREKLVSPYPVQGSKHPQGQIIKWAGQTILVHRVIWYLVHGDWPDSRVIHLDGDVLNDWIENLELERNVIIRKTKAGYVAKVRHENELIELGAYDNRSAAVSAIQFFNDLNGKGKHLPKMC